MLLPLHIKQKYGVGIHQYHLGHWKWTVAMSLLFYPFHTLTQPIFFPHPLPKGSDSKYIWKGCGVSNWPLIYHTHGMNLCIHRFLLQQKGTERDCCWQEGSGMEIFGSGLWILFKANNLSWFCSYLPTRENEVTGIQWDEIYLQCHCKEIGRQATKLNLNKD